MTRFIEHVAGHQHTLQTHGADQAHPSLERPGDHLHGLRTLCRIEYRQAASLARIGVTRRTDTWAVYWTKDSALVTCKRCRKTIDTAHRLGMRATSFEPLRAK